MKTKSDNYSDSNESEYIQEVDPTPKNVIPFEESSSRIPKPKIMEDYITYFTGSNSDISKMSEDAISRPDKDSWLKAIKK